MPDDVIPSPNIWYHPDVYEVENLAFDRAGMVENTMRAVHDWAGLDVLDIGCGTGFHLPRFAATARSVVGVEPHDPLVAMARRRVRGLRGVVVRTGGAAALPVPDASVDVAHARWAYFFGPGCEPGLRELQRVVRPGGVAFVVDNDATTSTFGGWFRRFLPSYDPAAVERFWSSHGWHRERVTTSWTTDSRGEFEAVVGIEFDAATVESVLAEHPGTSVDYAVNVWWKRF